MLPRAIETLRRVTCAPRAANCLKKLQNYPIQQAYYAGSRGSQIKVTENIAQSVRTLHIVGNLLSVNLVRKQTCGQFHVKTGTEFRRNKLSST